MQRPARRDTRGRPVTARLVTAGLALAALGLLGCAGGKPTGAVYEPLAPPDAGSSLIYIYRLDTLRGVSGGPLKLDGEKFASLRSGEYLAIVVDPGRHELRSSLLWLGLIARSWNSLEIEARAGETHFVKLYAATASIPGAPPSAEVPGRSDQKADVGLFMALVDRAEAELELRALRRADFE